MNMDNRLYCGAAVADITPSADMIPMKRGIGGSAFGGIIDPLKVRVIALGYGHERQLLISFDLGGAPEPAENIQEISKRTGVPEDNIMFVGTHAHAAPMVGSFGSMGARTGTDTNEYFDTAQKYKQLVYGAMFGAIDSAIAAMRPARMGHASGKSYINVNRNVDYVFTDENGERSQYCFLGYNGDGPVDRTLFVMRFEDYDGIPIAFYVNYPLHNVVMHSNTYFGKGNMGISSDIGGNLSAYMERKFDGAVAMWTAGSAGDVNPIMMSQHYMPNPETGKMITIETDGVAVLKTLVARHYDDVLRTEEKINMTRENCKLSAAVGWSRTPGRDVVPTDPTNPFGKVSIKTGEGIAPYEIRVHLMKIGDVALLGMSGELYTSLGLHLKEISPLRNTVIVTHDASHMVRSGYIYDDDGIARNALHHNRSRILPGYVKDSLTKVTIDLFDKVL